MVFATQQLGPHAEPIRDEEKNSQVNQRASLDGHRDGETSSITGTAIEEEPTTLVAHAKAHDSPLASSASSTHQDTTSAKSTNPLLRRLESCNNWLSHYSIEGVSVAPIPRSQRTDRRWWGPASIWFSANFNMLSFSTGTLVLSMDLSPTATFCTFIFISLFSSFFPAYFITFGPKLGLRQMIHARYSWGWSAPLIALLNAASMCGYTILNCILGGQTLSAVSNGGTLTPTVGIVIVAVVSLVVSFAGIRALHLFERWYWVPTLISFCILIGLAGTGPEGLHFPAESPTTTSTSVLSLCSVILGYLVSWAALGSDVSTYLDPDHTPSLWLFLTSYAAFFLGSTPLFLLGAGFALSARDNAAWNDALATSNGALFNLVMSSKTGNFGKFITVLLGLSIIGNTSASIYSFGLNLPAILPPLRHLPRFIFPLIIIAIVIPLSIVGASAFYDTLTSFTSILAYWSALYVSITLVDHVIIRKANFDSYDPAHWDRWTSHLPVGIAAITAAVVSLGLVIPSIDQVFFVGPIAERVGDLGFELGFVLSGLLYIPLRMAEKKLIGR